MYSKIQKTIEDPLKIELTIPSNKGKTNKGQQIKSI